MKKIINIKLMFLLLALGNSCAGTWDWIAGPQGRIEVVESKDFGYYLGSTNLGSTCYSNALMAHLASDTEFQTKLGEDIATKEQAITDASSAQDITSLAFGKELYNHISEKSRRMKLLAESEEKLLREAVVEDPFFTNFVRRFHVSVDDIIRANPLLGNGFVTTMQQNDPNDFLSVVMDILGIDPTDSQILHPYVESSYYISTSGQRFLKTANSLSPRIQLDLRYFDGIQNQGCHSVSQCLDFYYSPQSIPNKLTPSGADEDVNAHALFLTDETNHISPPEMLSIYLKRQALQADGTLGKDYSVVDINDIRIPFRDVSLVKALKTYSIELGSLNDLLAKIHDFGVTNIYNPYNSPNFIEYSPESVIIHLGTADAGHYISYSKIGGDFYIFDDTSVRLSGKELSKLPHVATNTHTILYKRKH